MQESHSRLHATNEKNMAYKEINMHSNKMAFALVLGMMMTNVWAESAPTTTSATTEEKTLVQSNSNIASEPQTEVRVEDIDAPIIE
jgi:hypothetical protein